MSAIKVSSTVATNHGRRGKGELWQERYFDHALRIVRDYSETVECIHLNPLKRGLAKRPEDWKWSSFHEDEGMDAAEQERQCGLAVDRVQLPSDENTKVCGRIAAESTQQVRATTFHCPPVTCLCRLAGDLVWVQE
jgi:urease accessory protein UreH